ncbi:MAG: glutathione S-transferase family protein [Rudaea sp.]|uniref:glutathione S-transferase family protein n=1 Tax=Rudaea sp. TaxID=2136325 RepID=UPI0039E35B3C
MLELYHALGSTCSQRVRQALAEKELPWTSRLIDFARDDQLAPDYLRLNPNGLVPTLVHDGVPVVDSSVILEYLEDAFPQRPLRPADAVGKARMREWCAFIDEVPTPAARVPSFHYLFSGGIRKMSRDQLLAIAERRPLRRAFYLKMGQRGFAKEELVEAERQLRYTLERAEQSLQATSWLAGDALSLADISLLPTLARLEDLRMDTLWGDLAAVQDWYRRITARASFEAAYMPGSRTLRPARDFDDDGETHA